MGQWDHVRVRVDDMHIFTAQQRKEISMNPVRFLLPLIKGEEK